MGLLWADGTITPMGAAFKLRESAFKGKPMTIQALSDKKISYAAWAVGKYISVLVSNPSNEEMSLPVLPFGTLVGATGIGQKDNNGDVPFKGSDKSTKNLQGYLKSLLTATKAIPVLKPWDVVLLTFEKTTLLQI
jgi:hypothetical protein